MDRYAITLGKKFPEDSSSTRELNRKLGGLSGLVLSEKAQSIIFKDSEETKKWRQDLT
jgi:hypothetical protein